MKNTKNIKKTPKKKNTVKIDKVSITKVKVNKSNNITKKKSVFQKLKEFFKIY